MKSLQKKRKFYIPGILSALLTFIQVAGWQISMDYGSSVHQSAFFQNIGMLSKTQCLLWGSIEFLMLFFCFYLLFQKLQQHTVPETVPFTLPKFFGCFSFLLLFLIWMIFLWGCYPGYYNYDVGNQLPMFLYEEVPYNAHHPLLHTLILGSLVSLGYHIYTIDISFGIFLYNAVQMMVCAACLSCALCYLYKRTRSKLFTALSFVFYAICPPIVMFAMSTTKDVLCFSLLLLAMIRLMQMEDKKKANIPLCTLDWLILGGSLTLSCLLRKNIVYALAVFLVLSVIFIRNIPIRHLFVYIGIIVLYLLTDKALQMGFDAIPGSINEAMCIPYQQIARLYNEKGEEAFTDEEYELLCQVIPPKSLLSYDPVMGDHTKANFNPGLETIMNHKWTYFKLWVKKGLEYPQIYIESILYNTYQAWYPFTSITEQRGVRYFDITGWQDEYGSPHWQGLYNFYKGIRYGSYTGYPLLRLFFSTGFMFCILLVSWFYAILCKNKGAISAMLFVLLVCATTFCGPVSDVRYYLILFYLMPVCVGLMLPVRTKTKTLN